MTATEVISLIRQKLVEVQRSGATSVDILSVHALLNAIERNLNQPAVTAEAALKVALADREGKLSIDLAAYGANTSRSLQAVEAGNKAGAESIKAVTLINGGATVALLAFIGHLASISAPRFRAAEFSSKQLYR
jgi:hypothetical protein